MSPVAGGEAARELGALLRDPDRPYRARWEAHGTAYRDRPLNHTSVARVLAAHLVDTAGLDEAEEDGWPRRRRDWLRHRLSGRKLDRTDLALFADAFGFDARDRERLRVQYEAAAGSIVVPAYADGGHLTALADLPPPGSYQTVAVTERHRIGAHGRPEHHRTEQTIRSTVPVCRAYLYLFDADCVSVHVVRGGTASEPRPVRAGVWGVVITLDRTLGTGDTIDLVYETSFAYASDPPPEFRRGASAFDSQIEVEVSFHPDRLPTRVHQCAWQSIADDEPLVSALVEPDGTHTVRARYTLARVGLVGFSWTW